MSYIPGLLKLSSDPVVMFIASMLHSNQYFVHLFDEVCDASREVWLFMTDEEREPFLQWFRSLKANGIDDPTQPFRADADLVLRVAKVVRQREEDRKEAAVTDAMLSDLAKDEKVADNANEGAIEGCDRNESAEAEMDSTQKTEPVDEEIAKRLKYIEGDCARARSWLAKLERERVRLVDHDERSLWCQVTTNLGLLNSSTSGTRSVSPLDNDEKPFQCQSTTCTSENWGASLLSYDEGPVWDQLTTSPGLPSSSKSDSWDVGVVDHDERPQWGQWTTGQLDSAGKGTRSHSRRRKRGTSKSKQRKARTKSEGAGSFEVGEWKAESGDATRSRSRKRNTVKNANKGVSENCIFKGMTYWTNDLLHNCP